MERGKSFRQTIFVFIGRGQFPYDPAWISGSQYAGWNVFCDHTSGTDDGTIADGDTGEDNGMSTDPDVISDLNGKRIFQSTVSLFDIERMTGGIESAIWRDKNVIAERDGSIVQDHAIVIGVKVVSDFDIISESAKEGWFDIKFFGSFRQ